MEKFKYLKLAALIVIWILLVMAFTQFSYSICIILNIITSLVIVNYLRIIYVGKKIEQRTLRIPKETDQQEIAKAYNLISDLIANHAEIESALWPSALWSILVSGNNSTGMSHDQFIEECDRVKIHYKSWFDT